MTQTVSDDTVPVHSDTRKINFRLDRYETLAAAKGYVTVIAQARWHGIDRAAFTDIRAGRTAPLLTTALGIAEDCGCAVEFLWGRI